MSIPSLLVLILNIYYFIFHIGNLSNLKNDFLIIIFIEIFIPLPNFIGFIIPPMAAVIIVVMRRYLKVSV